MRWVKQSLPCKVGLTAGLLLLLFPPVSQGQEPFNGFAPLGAEWYYQDYSPGCGAESFTRLLSSRDTLVDDRACRVIEVFKNDSQQPVTDLIVCEQDRQVFFHEDDQFKLLYDFNLQAGDTLTFHVPQNRHFFEFSCLLDTFALSNPYRVLVTGADSVLIDGDYYRRLETEPLPDEVDCFELGTIIEKVGSLNGFSGFDCIQCVVGCTGHFRCYRDGDIFYQLSEESCDFTTDVERPAFSGGGLRLYPNPSRETVAVELPAVAQPSGYYRIADLSGRMVRSGDFTGTVNVAGLAPGSYMLSVVLDSGRGYMGRFIVGR